VYAIKDQNLDSGDPRSTSNSFVEQTMTPGICPNDNPYCEPGEPIVTVTKHPVDWATNDGWYVDFPVAGERVNTTMRLVQGTLVLMTNTPQTGACVPAGVSYAYFLDYQTGGYVGNDESQPGGIKWGDYLVTSPVIVQNPDGSIGVVAQGDGSGAGFLGSEDAPTSVSGDSVRRLSWRELIIE
jgi:type IV pilus assembly protein PilY1